MGIVQKRLRDVAKRHVRAGRLLLGGKDCSKVAVGVARQTVYTWKRLLEEEGINARRAVLERGRPAPLDEAQLARARIAAGSCASLWTASADTFRLSS